jgi:hypothetical protein
MNARMLKWTILLVLLGAAPGAWAMFPTVRIVAPQLPGSTCSTSVDGVSPISLRGAHRDAAQQIAAARGRPALSSVGQAAPGGIQNVHTCLGARSTAHSQLQ